MVNISIFQATVLIAYSLLTTSCVEGKLSFNFAGEEQNRNVKDGIANKSSEDAEKDKKEESSVIGNLVLEAVTDEEALHDALEGEEQLSKLCARYSNDPAPSRVIRAFCVDKIRPKSLVELQAALGFSFQSATGNRNNNGANGNPAFALQGHSSSLVGRFTSSINPRVIMMTPDNLGNNNANVDAVVMGFVRGEQFAEIIVTKNDANNDGAQDLEVFLIAFKQACNSRPDGCSPGELLTPMIESDWTSFTMYDDEDLKNTIVDCRHCHQPEGLNSPKIMRMQELRNPWTHWFRDNTDGNALTDDYFAAHGDQETYGGVPPGWIAASDPQKLENMVRGNGFRELQVREIEFQTADIRDEIENDNPAQPEDNSMAGVSDTWESLFQNAADGVAADGRTIIPIPYHDVKVTEPELLTKFTQQYQGFLSGNVSIEQFEDHRNVLVQDQTLRANMGFAIRPGTDPKTMMMQACHQCHNSKLDQSISRAKFNVDLDAMGENAVAEINVAIDRLKLGYTTSRLKQEEIFFVGKDEKIHELAKGEHLLTMPPRRFKQLTNEQIDELIAYLKEEQKRLMAN